MAVDFTAWGGNIERGCDVSLTTGYHALHAAGFTTAGDAEDGAGFICRIDDEPPPSEDPCVTTPPADAYWSYWHADAGQNTWTYSEEGATSYHPPPGSVDAWTFGSTDIEGTDGQPSFPPSAVRAGSGPGPGSTTTTPPAPTTTAAPAPERTSAAAGPPTTAPATSSPTSPSTAPPTTSAPGGGTGHHAVASSEGPASTSPATSAGGRRAPVAAAPSTPKIVDAAPVVTPRGSAGSAVPLLVGAGILVALAAAAGVAVWRRRRVG